MRPTQHESCNDVLHSPSGVSHDECGNLPITRCSDGAGKQMVASFWKPTADELKHLNSGLPVTVVIWGRTHPPIMVGVAGNKPTEVFGDAS